MKNTWKKKTVSTSYFCTQNPIYFSAGRTTGVGGHLLHYLNVLYGHTNNNATLHRSPFTWNEHRTSRTQIPLSRRWRISTSFLWQLSQMSDNSVPTSVNRINSKLSVIIWDKKDIRPFPSARYRKKLSTDNWAWRVTNTLW